MDVLSSSQIALDVWAVVKGFFIFGMAIYIIFALVIVRQVAHMTHTLQVGFETPIKLLGYLHLLAAIGLLVITIFIL